MRADPRCPSCAGKVSATARWCIHCGSDFESPTDASETASGGTVTTTATAESGDADDRGSPASKVDDARTRDGRGSPVSKAPVEASAAPDDREVDEGTGWDRMPERSTDPDLRTGDPDGPGPDGTVGRTPLGTVVANLEGSTGHRNALAVLVPVTAWFLASPGTTGAAGAFSVAGALALGLYLYTRSAARTVLAASATGTGLLVGATRAIDVATGAGSAVDAAASAWFLLAGALVAAGAWLRRRRF